VVGNRLSNIREIEGFVKLNAVGHRQPVVAQSEIMSYQVVRQFRVLNDVRESS
jgi:hypothetical protein